MAHYTGISSVDTLFDSNLAELPRRSALHSASLRNDVASARLFMHNMDAFIEHVLGTPPKQMKTKAFDGLFGDVKAYFGVVETQGGGTLHAHFLIWLANAPPNTDAFIQATAEHGDQYYRDIAAYADSIVSTSLPLDVAVSCHFCGHSFDDLQALPIPPEAYESPNACRGSARAEPLLVQCPQCATKMSSQHVLRRAILQQRPSTWPPQLRTYSSEELNAAVHMEINCRGSVSAAKAAVFHRDMILATRDSVDDTYGEYLRTLNAVPNRSEQREDDAFCDDNVAQAIMTLPPSVEDERWTPNATAFAVSMLVSMLNLHWWSHVGSCFKSSRVSAPGQCRYRLPRVRVTSTSCTSAGVVLARRPPFEYINGYNAIMMLAFKSNHDIQVLIGGSEALLRIYYATKYVTKMQNEVDSVTAVALAAFKRRETRELQNQTSRPERSAVGRTRVASMAFALTNRREIAGPLAALYLLRGSCAYMSASCTSLPLYDVLRELIQHDTHSCNLVELQEGESNVTFRAASFLDDYIFRPLSLGRTSRYEFVMAWFRCKQSKSTATSDMFLIGHPLYSTHCIGHHQLEAVPVITGARMPYVDSKTPLELVVKRAQCALVLFKPFRTVLDLVSEPANDAAWVDAYFQWESTRTSFIREVMANMDDYYHASTLAQEDGESVSNRIDYEADGDELIGSRNDIDGAVANMQCDNDTSVDGGRIDDFCHVFAEDDAADGGSLPVFPTTRTGSLLSSIVQQELLGPTAESAARAAIDLGNDEREPGLSVAELQEWVKDPMSDEAESSLTGLPCGERRADMIELIQSALKSGGKWSPPNQQHGCPTPPLRPYPSINGVSTAFTLNRRQHVAFSLIARALFRRFQQQERANIHKSADYRAHDFASRLRDDQLLMFLGGAGGTGKSRVVDAVSAFCSGWHRTNSLVKAALTGKAATLISGRTLASFLVRLEHALKMKKFAPLDLLLIDEVSMMSKAEWVKLDKLLRRYIQIENIPFGGIHVVLVGDFLQMPPVKSDPIYLDPIGKAKPNTVDVGGFELWRRFTVVIILDECVRFRDDPEWGEGCRNARLGHWTSAFVDMINARVVQATHDRDNVQHLQDEAVASVVFVTPENSTRLAINNAFIKETAAKLPNDVYPFRVIANFKGALNGLSRSDLCYVLSPR